MRLSEIPSSVRARAEEKAAEYATIHCGGNDELRILLEKKAYLHFLSLEYLALEAACYPGKAPSEVEPKVQEVRNDVAAMIA